MEQITDIKDDTINRYLFFLWVENRISALELQEMQKLVLKVYSEGINTGYDIAVKNLTCKTLVIE